MADSSPGDYRTVRRDEVEEGGVAPSFLEVEGARRDVSPDTAARAPRRSRVVAAVLLAAVALTLAVVVYLAVRGGRDSGSDSGSEANLSGDGGDSELATATPSRLTTPGPSPGASRQPAANDGGDYADAAETVAEGEEVVEGGGGEGDAEEGAEEKELSGVEGKEGESPIPASAVPEIIFWNETQRLTGDGLAAWTPLGGDSGPGAGRIDGPPSADGYDPRYGTSVALSADGSALLVGADLLANGEDTNAGVVYAYSLRADGDGGGSGAFHEPLGRSAAGGDPAEPGVVARGGPFESLGDAVALSASGRRAVVASSYWSRDRATDRNYGRVQTFDLDPRTGEWAKSTDDLHGTMQFDNFGGALALSDDGRTLAAGAAQSGPTSRDNPGYVLAFRDVGDGAWTPLGQRLEGVPGNAGGAVGGDGDAFGAFVALSADGLTLAASARGYKTGYGYVRVYSFVADKDDENGGTWLPLGPPVTAESISDGESGPGREFGGAVSLSPEGRTLAVGSPGEGKKIWPNGGVSPRNNGAVRVFSFDVDEGFWIQRGATLKGRDGDSLGDAVALSLDGGALHAGASQYWKLGLGPGSVVSCEWMDGRWLRLGEPLRGEMRNRESGDSFGRSLAVSRNGAVLVAGAYFGNYVNVYGLT